MRILLALNNTYTDPYSGAARSMKTMMEWLSDAGHDCAVFCTARFDGFLAVDIERHLAEFAGLTSADGTAFLEGEAPVTFDVAGIPVTLVPIARKNTSNQTPAEIARVMRQFAALERDFRPEILVTYGAGRLVQSFLYRARASGIATVFSLHNYGYGDRDTFRFVDHALSCSPYLSRFYRARIGLRGEGIPVPMAWDETLAGNTPERRHLTFVNPSAHKGLALFAALVRRLVAERPEIPILIVQSVADPEELRKALGFDPSDHAQFTVVPGFRTPAEIFARTRVLLAPSFFEEPFGRIAAEALINGTPVLVSDRGALPETVADGGIVLPVAPNAADGISDDMLAPWIRSLRALWDDTAFHEALSARARAEGLRLYGEQDLRARYDRYFRTRRPGSDPFAEAEQDNP